MDRIKHIEMTPLSDDDIRTILGKDTKILEYKDLTKYSSIDQLLPKPTDYCILLYELQKDSGHWTAILKYDDIVEFFDPYGLKYDNELAWISNNIKAKLHEDQPLLSNLLNNTNHTIIYNKTRFQSMKSDVSTCGDHCAHRIYRLIHNDFNLDEYISYMKHIKDEHGLTYDEIVSEFVSSFI